MSKHTGHTPGPLRVAVMTAARATRIGDEYIGVATESGRGVARVSAVSLANETDRANARLFAAAPDLLEACEAMLHQRYSSWHRFAEEDEPEPDDMQLARRAIAKATAPANRTEDR